MKAGSGGSASPAVLRLSEPSSQQEDRFPWGLSSGDLPLL